MMSNTEIMAESFKRKESQSLQADDDLTQMLERMNKTMRKVWGLVSLPCDLCSATGQCCCGNCGLHFGYFEPEEFRRWKDEIAKTLRKKGAKNWNGFWNPKCGCMLPAHVRSRTCVLFSCSHIPGPFKRSQPEGEMFRGFISEIDGVLRKRGYFLAAAKAKRLLTYVEIIRKYNPAKGEK